MNMNLVTFLHVIIESGFALLCLLATLSMRLYDTGGRKAAKVLNKGADAEQSWAKMAQGLKAKFIERLWNERMGLYSSWEYPDYMGSVLAEKIVNGLIANIMESMDAGDLSFSPDNISVNYVKKDKDNALFYWGKKNIENVPDETQFVRLFSATYSKKMYFVTYTLKMNINDMSVEDITKYMKTLNSIQELKKNEAGGQQQ